MTRCTAHTRSLTVALSLLALGGCKQEYRLAGELAEQPLADGLDTSSAPSDTDETSMPSPSTRGREFWIGFMENLTLAFNGPPEFALLVTADGPTQVEIELPATGLLLSHDVGEGTTMIDLPHGVYYPEGFDDIAGTGIVVRADQTIDLVAVHARLYFSEASLILPQSELGSDYFVMARRDTFTGEWPSEFTVVATEDGTMVDITPSVLTTGLRPADVTYSVALDSGEVYQAQATGDLSGTRIQSDAPVAVFGGGRDVAIECSATSHLWDQMLPLARWGTEYVVVPFEQHGGDDVAVIAARDDTTVKRDCADDVVLQAGEVFSFTASQRVSITADGPIGVSQAAKGTLCSPSRLGDPSLLVVSPAALYRNRVSFLTFEHELLTDGPMRQDNAGVVVGDSADLYLDGSPVTETRDLGPAWTIASPRLSVGAHVLESAAGLRGSTYGFTDFNAYTYGLGYDCEGCEADLLRTDQCD